MTVAAIDYRADRIVIAADSARPTRRRERQMQRFKSSEQAQGFLSAHGCRMLTSQNFLRVATIIGTAGEDRLPANKTQTWIRLIGFYRRFCRAGSKSPDSCLC